MTKLPQQREIKALRQVKRPYCLSLYMPPIEGAEAGKVNRIVLKNMLRKAENLLKEAGASYDHIHAMMVCGRELLDDPQIWSVQRVGFAIFINDKKLWYFQIPQANFVGMVSVGRGFNLRPLDEVMSHNTPYYLLSLGHKGVKLYHGDKYRLMPVNLKDFPSDMKKALRIDEMHNWRELHTVASADRGKGSEGYHSQYDATHVDKKMLQQFFRMIDKRLERYFGTAMTEPLLVAGASYLQAIYKKVNTYSHMVPVMIDGNVSRENPDSLRNKAIHALRSWNHSYGA